MKSNINKKKRIAFASLLLATLLWSTGGVFIKLISLDPFTIAGLRSLFAALVFLPVIGNPFRIKLNKLKLLCALFYAGNVILLVSATKYTTSANAILLQYTAPVYVILLSGKLLNEKAEKRDYLTVLGVLTGMIIFAFDGLSNRNLFGNFSGMLAGVCFAGVLLTTKRIHLSLQPMSAFEPLFIGNLLAAMICIPFYPTKNISNDILILPIIGILQLGVPYLLYAYAAKYMTAVKTSLITTFEPIMNPVWVFLATKELPSSLTLLGGTIVFASVIFYSLKFEGRSREIRKASIL